MATLAGALISSPIGGDAPPGVTAMLSGYSAPFANVSILPSAAFGGALSGTGVVAIAHTSLSGGAVKMFGGELFNKIIVVPRKKSVGILLSTQTFTVEVWNSFLDEIKSLSSINITGAGGVSVTDPYGVPLSYGPQQSQTYVVNVQPAAHTTINNVVTFSFPGIGGTDLAITGTRITLFSPEIDWSKGFVEVMAWLTDVMEAYSDLEQRVQLRTLPRYSCKFNTIAMTQRESAQLMALLWGWQHRIYGVPWWVDAGYFTANTAAGATSIPVDATLKPGFVTGALVMLWRNQFVWEVFEIGTVGASSIGITSPTLLNWTVNDLVVPLRRGRLKDSIKFGDPSRDLTALMAEFDCEVA